MKKKFITVVTFGVCIEILSVLILSIGDIKEKIPLFALLYTSSFLVYVFSVFYVLKNFVTPDTEETSSRRLVFWSILVFAFIFRFTLFPMTPSDDVFRYLWEGRLQLHGINPYLYPPGSPELEYLRDNFFEGINHKHLTTIYPPLTLIVFAIADYVSHSVLSLKAIFLVFDLLSIVLLAKFLKRMRRAPEHVLIYAWSPLILMSFAGRGHCDSLQIFFVMLAIYLFSARKIILSTVSIALAVMSKFVFVIVVPFLLPKHKLKYLALMLLLIALLYIPYLSAGKGLFSTLFHFGTHYHFNDSVHFLILCITGGSSVISKVVILAIFSLVMLYLCISAKGNLKQDEYMIPSGSFQQSNRVEYCPGGLYHGGEALRFAFLSIGTLILLAPTVHPWYLTWIVPFLCFYHSKAWILFTGSIVFYYLMNHALFSTLIEHNNEWVWREVHWLKLPEYVPFYCLLLYELLKYPRIGKIVCPEPLKGK
ncbi:MAG: hypothetical protein D8M57_08370 [Candidatus Scalindua sp. AMX11]|nr:MAG: hypothetical protein DWQ00_05225 [Candidatus Scalindua sp.]NOG84356.1 hypothetical protein [Planctomycetota bacterium]RZV74437.1 MAG: hypothetical protein EX341_13105 [Candidatus Scalindua sp. SCAELEC01]TDE65358.1 MAG: hypothetical protein D8M57_08370 [Candidatus Scalindua sp. AMX11]